MGKKEGKEKRGWDERHGMKWAEMQVDRKVLEQEDS